jgi:hypothetical protein
MCRVRTISRKGWMAKQAELETFSSIVRAMASGHHRTPGGFVELLETAVSMNGNGRYRRCRWREVISGHPESSETVRQTG